MSQVIFHTHVKIDGSVHEGGKWHMDGSVQKGGKWHMGSLNVESKGFQHSLYNTISVRI